MAVDHEILDIPTESLVVDDQNPRFFHLRIVHGRTNLSQEEILSEISNDSEIGFLIKSIQQKGVQNPIWVKPLDFQKYLVLEGNRRTYVLKRLCKEGIQPPKGIRFDMVKANVVSRKTSDVDLLLLKISIQTGKKSWRAFNEAAATYELVNTHQLSIKEVATVNMISKREVRMRIENFGLFQDFIRISESTDISKFSFFSDMPSAVRKWIKKSDKNKKQYFQLITPDSITGIQRLPSATTKGGARDFGRLLADERVAQAFIKDDNMSMDRALGLLGRLDIWKEYKWLGAAEKLIEDLIILDEEDVKKIARKKKAVRLVKNLSLASQVLLERINDVDK
jgi:hypothetical protein